ALYIVFDLLVDERGAALVEHSLKDRRIALERFAKTHLAAVLAPRSAATARLSPATQNLKQAKEWFSGGGATLDGVIAKRLDCDYRTGTRDGMVKIKRLRT